MRFIFSLILSLAAASLAGAVEPALTLPAAQRLAAERSRQLVAQDSAVLASRSQSTARFVVQPSLASHITATAAGPRCLP